MWKHRTVLVVGVLDQNLGDQGPGVLLRLQVISKLQEAVPLQENAAVEGGSGIISLLSFQSSPKLHSLCALPPNLHEFYNLDLGSLARFESPLCNESLHQSLTLRLSYLTGSFVKIKWRILSAALAFLQKKLH